MSTRISKPKKKQPGALQFALIRAIREFIAGAVLHNQRLADQLGINYTDQQVLNLVDLAGGAKPGDLARMTGLTTGGVTVCLDRLERAGFIRRERNPDDRRSVIVRTEPERMKQIVALYKSVNEVMGEIFSAYSERELETVLDFLERTNRTRVETYSAEESKKSKSVNN
jgi:MarR family transcriptional regulator, organic hydroperoxide resistance regulator